MAAIGSRTSTRNTYGGVHPNVELDMHRITEVGQLLVVPRHHPLAKRRRASLADLDGERLVLPPEGRPQRRTLDAALAAKGVSVTVGALATGWSSRSGSSSSAPASRW